MCCLGVWKRTMALSPMPRVFLFVRELQKAEAQVQFHYMACSHQLSLQPQYLNILNALLHLLAIPRRVDLSYLFKTYHLNVVAIRCLDAREKNNGLVFNASAFSPIQERRISLRWFSTFETIACYTGINHHCDPKTHPPTGLLRSHASRPPSIQASTQTPTPSATPTPSLTCHRTPPSIFEPTAHPEPYRTRTSELTTIHTSHISQNYNQP